MCDVDALYDEARDTIARLEWRLFISEQAYYRLEIQYAVATKDDDSLYNLLQDGPELGYTLDPVTAAIPHVIDMMEEVRRRNDTD